MSPAPRTAPWAPLRATAAYCCWLSRIAEISCTRLGGKAAIDEARRRRFDGLLEFARMHSPFYREAYRGLSDSGASLSDLPVVTKRTLMTHFDDWVTDREVRRSGVEQFLADRSHIGERYLDRYVVWKSSGSTGEPGIYVQDQDALTTFDALMAVHLDPTWFASHAWESMSGGGRAALVVATGDHFASIASWQRARRSMPGISARSFSILEPLPQLVRQLNDYRPAFLASYPTMLSLLAEEQNARRLHLAPLNIWSGGEYLAPTARSAIERAFGCRVVNEYGASECMSIAFSCVEDWLHVNADWVVLEPVDSGYRSMPPGEPSYTTLLTNLANHAQPLLRYDLGDSILVSPATCACGSPLPAMRVEGRRDDVVSLCASNGSTVRLLPLALTTVVEESTHVHRFQIVQTAPDRLMLRFDCADHGDRHRAWRAAADALRTYLTRQSLSNVHVGLDEQRPLVDHRSGKLREVVVAKESASSDASATTAAAMTLS